MKMTAVTSQNYRGQLDKSPRSVGRLTAVIPTQRHCAEKTVGSTLRDDKAEPTAMKYDGKSGCMLTDAVDGEGR